MEAKKQSHLIGVEETAQIIGVSESIVIEAVKKRYLKWLGNPAQNARKYFARADVENIDRSTLEKIVRLAYEHTQKRNQGRVRKENDESEEHEDL